MIEEEDLVMIERSLAGELTTSELEEFGHRLASDPTFATHYSIMAELPEAITTDVEGFSTDLKAIMGEGKSGSTLLKRPGSLKKMILSVAAIGIGIAIVATLLNLQSTPDLFVQHFTIPSENITTRNSSSLEPELQEALVAYREQNFEIAAQYFDKYLQSNPGDYAATFYLAISLLSIEKYAQAIEHFRTLEGSPNVFRNSAHWYHGLIELKRNQKEKALDHFQILADTPGQSYQQKARDIIDQLK